MKRYNEYMNSAEVSPEFHERLTGLTAPKQAAHWKKYGAMAAALVLVVGIGAFGLSRAAGTDTPLMGQEEIGLVDPAIDIAPVEPGDDVGDQPNGGGYEMNDGQMTAYYMLPAIGYNEPGDTLTADYSLAPPGALSREAGLDDVKALLDGADMAGHLLWTDELEWGGTLWFLENGAPCAAALWAKGGDVQFYIEMMAGSEVPSCIVFPENSYETTSFQGVEITALKNTGYAVVDGAELRESRVLSCFADGVGYKLTIYGVDGERVENMCSRFARWAIVEGFDLSALSMEGAEPFDLYDPDYSVGEPNREGGASTQEYDPAAGN